MSGNVVDIVEISSEYPLPYRSHVSWLPQGLLRWSPIDSSLLPQIILELSRFYATFSLLLRLASLFSKGATAPHIVKHT
jgi:hypothetical protein